MQVFCRFISFGLVVNAAQYTVHGIPCTLLLIQSHVRRYKCRNSCIIQAKSAFL